MLVQNAKEEKVASEIVPDYQKKMEERFERVVKITDSLMATLEELKKQIEPTAYLKLTPVILAVWFWIITYFIWSTPIEIL